MVTVPNLGPDLLTQNGVAIPYTLMNFYNNVKELTSCPKQFKSINILSEKLNVSEIAILQRWRRVFLRMRYDHNKHCVSH